jgi:hypothetical protein
MPRPTSAKLAVTTVATLVVAEPEETDGLGLVATFCVDLTKVEPVTGLVTLMFWVPELEGL